MMLFIGKRLGLVALLILAVGFLNNCGGGGSASTGGPIPAAPSGLTVVVSNKQVLLHWNAAADAATYRVYFEYSPGLTKTSGIKIPDVITGTSYAFFTSSNNGTYYFIVTGVNSTGLEGPASVEIAAKLAPPTPPATVGAIASNGTGTPQVTITWTRVSEATSYSIYCNTTSSVSTLLASVGTATSYTHTPLLNGTTYYYAVRGQNAFGAGPASQVTSATPTAAAAAAITVSGRIAYEDKEYDQVSGFTNVTTFKAVRFADLDLVDAAGSPIAPMTRTDSNGYYSFPGLSSAYLGTNAFVRVISSATPTASQTMNVKDRSNRLYTVNSAAVLLSGNATVNLGIPVTSQADGAFNILDVMTSGFQFVNSHAAVNPTLSLNAFWQNGVSDGTYYCPGYDAAYCPNGTGIYVLSDPFGFSPNPYDTDEFDDDVLIHEFGHFTADNFSADDSKGGSHALSGNAYDLRLTWSEGWGDFFPGAVKFWLNATAPLLVSAKTGVPLSEYVDTVDGQAYLIVDIADPDNSAGNSPYCLSPYDGTPMCTYATNEIAVANVLWNHMTGAGSYGMQSVWDVIAGFKTTPPSTADPVNLELFYDRWKNLYGSPVAAIYTNRHIDYSDDSYEADDLFTTAQNFTVNTSQNRRLYSSARWPNVDEDYVMFTATGGTLYTIATSNLLNGIDTYLTLYDQNGVTEITTSAATRDNTNGMIWIAEVNYDKYDVYGNWLAAPLNTTTNLASRIQWTATSTGTYFVKISSSPDRPKSAGKYCSYALAITSP